MPTANPEQRKAIESSFGVALNAGAGSGKTFVIVNHLIHRIAEKEAEFLQYEDIELRRSVRNILSQIVLMTFTKKAAGEIQLRVAKEINIKANKEGNSRFWACVSENVDCLLITTIHGFCYRVISEGIIPNVDVPSKMLNNYEFEEKIIYLLEKWAENHESNSDFFDYVLSHQRDFIKIVVKIFNDPGAREDWLGHDCEKSDQWKLFPSLLGLRVLGHTTVELPIDKAHREKKWYFFLQQMDLAPESYQNYASLMSIFEKLNDLSRLPPKPREDSLNHIKDVFEDFKILKKFAKNNFEDFSLYDSYRRELEKWPKEFSSLIRDIDSHYHDYEGGTFSDLEYFLLKGTESSLVLKQIRQRFNYFIVDEFQDTSWPQYKILERIVGDDSSRLFIVGDIKQAIYGFRGGELGVFKQCEHKIQNSLSLINNYRSSNEIVEFNNSFFRFVLPLGNGFKDKDFFSVVASDQTPGQNLRGGGVEQVLTTVECEEETKFTSDQVNGLEAESILKWIKNNDEKEVCVLYKRLSPSKKLLSLLIQNNIGFTAQVKAPFLNDPIVGLFDLFLTNGLKTENERGHEELCQFLFDQYCQLLTVKGAKDFSTLANKFERLYGLFDVMTIFRFILKDLGINNSRYEENIKPLATAINLGEENREEICSMLKKLSRESLQLEFIYGKDPQKIKIMSAHASKGLEFNTVILAGIHTNGHYITKNDVLGKMNASFKWKKDKDLKKYYKTPNYVLEQLIEKQKDFSESKRLLYVACTRAEKKLVFFDFVFSNSKFSYRVDSWVNAFRTWSKESTDSHNSVIKKEGKIVFSSGKSIEKSAPIFHQDKMGLTFSPEQMKMPLAIFPEMSVTKMTSAIECPRKFYLENICKIETDSLVNYQQSSSQGLSSADRGIKLHRQLELFLAGEGDFPTVLDRSWFEKELLNGKEEFHMVLESPLKFSFYGHMVTGTPDALLEKNQVVKEIWDFKTGAIETTKNDKYFAQLKLYALALHKMGKTTTDTISLKLIYLDEKEVLVDLLRPESIEDFQKVIFQKMTSTHEINPSHCQVCPYQSICHIN